MTRFMEGCTTTQTWSTGEGVYDMVGWVAAGVAQHFVHAAKYRYLPNQSGIYSIHKVVYLFGREVGFHGGTTKGVTWLAFEGAA